MFKKYLHSIDKLGENIGYAKRNFIAPEIKKAVKALTPPILLDLGRFLVSSIKTKSSYREKRGEKGAEWYDASFEGNDRWKAHYTESDYYFIWTVIIDRILRSGTSSILEIGCGSGQLASFIRDSGIKNYHGFDFSGKRLEQAKLICPEFTFTKEDAFKTDLFEKLQYDTVVCTEFLEHIEGDIDILKRIKSETKFYGTVPNFPYISHVRHFNGKSEVVARYTQYFDEFHVDTILANKHGKTFYLLEGKIA